jgi:FMN reductase
LGARHILGVVYAVDKQVTWSETQTVILEEEIDQRLKNSLETLVKSAKH